MAKLRMVREDHLLDTDTVAGELLAGAFGYRGTGSPIGQLDDAEVGSRYTDEAVTDGAAVWVKYPAGWRVAIGDTGWIDLSPAAGAVNNHPAVKVHLRRIGGVVHAAVFETAPSVAGANVTTILNLPAGWRQDGGGRVFAGQVIDMASAAPLTASVFVSPESALRIYRAPSAMHGASLSWPAEPSWPST